MENDEKKMLINAWVTSASEDLEIANKLFTDKKFSYSLFFCQLALEKLLKALCVKNNDTYPPITHDLIKLAGSSKAVISNEDKDYLAEISTFNIEARYDIFKEKLYKKATSEYTERYIGITQRLFNTLSQML